MKLTINGSSHELDIEPDTPLLWVLRDEVGLTGTKYGCGIAQCGACTVHIDGEARRSCQVLIGDIDGSEVTTIEGRSEGSVLALVQQAWIDQQVAQCGYCQSGQIMQATALLELNDDPSDEDIDRVMSGNLCRCGTYPRIRAAIHDAAEKVREA